MITADLATIETDLTAAALYQPNLTELDLTGTHYDNPTLGDIWDAIRTLRQAGTTPDPVNTAKTAGVPYQAVLDLAIRATTHLVGNGTGYAQTIREAHMRRRLDTALTAAHQRINSPDWTITQTITDLTQSLNTTTGTNPADQTQTLDQFVDQPLPDTEWVTPGLLACGDRLIITGPEGFGKSQLVRQLAVAAAAGIHPLTAAPAAPRRALLVDTENPRRIMIGALKTMRDNLRRTGHETNDRLNIARYPQGLDLATEKDQLQLHALCRQHNPDILAIGPAYKLYVGGSNTREEDLARTVTNALDQIREQYNCTIILEHHSPHAQPGQNRTTRPIGSSLWLRWPEFGIGIRPTPESTRNHRIATLEHWRGMREERDWPERIEQDTLLPWRETAPDSWQAA